MAARNDPLTPVPTSGTTKRVDLDETLLPAMAWRSLHLMCRRSLARHVDLTVEGLEHVPRTGPVLIAARHYHHLYDGCAIGTTLPRHLHVLVAMDWLQRPAARGLMARACRAARFPVVIRPGAADRRQDLRDNPAARAAFDAEASRSLRRAAADTVALLRGGHVVLVFPEGYPNVDPGDTPKTGEEFLPFEPGFARLVALAQRDGGPRVPIVPAGLAYVRGPHWNLTLRYGLPLFLDQTTNRFAFVREVEAQVKELSAPRNATHHPS